MLSPNETHLINAAPVIGVSRAADFFAPLKTTGPEAMCFEADVRKRLSS
jgi:hypothetical protein